MKKKINIKNFKKGFKLSKAGAVIGFQGKKRVSRTGFSKLMYRGIAVVQDPIRPNVMYFGNGSGPLMNFSTMSSMFPSLSNQLQYPQPVVEPQEKSEKAKEFEGLLRNFVGI